MWFLLLFGPKLNFNHHLCFVFVLINLGSVIMNKPAVKFTQNSRFETLQVYIDRPCKTRDVILFNYYVKA